MKRPLSPACLALLAAAALASSACKSAPEGPEELLLRSSIAGAEAPDWVGGRIPSGDGSVAFVGRGGGLNVLDERGAFDEALSHARTQLAQYVATRVSSAACFGDDSVLTRYLPHDGSDALTDPYVLTRVHEASAAVVGGVTAIDQYWELWDLQEGGGDAMTSQGSTGFRRYKCWVLARVEEATIQRYVDAALDLVAREEAAESSVGLQQELALAQEQSAVSRADLAHARDVLQATNEELQALRERVHYGRRFRLSGGDEDLGYRPSTAAGHPDWRSAEVLTRTELVPVTFEPEAPAPEPHCTLYGADAGMHLEG